MKRSAISAIFVLCALGAAAHGDTIEQLVRSRVQPPAQLGIARVYVPASVAALEVDPAKVAIEVPGELRAGRASVKVSIRGRAPLWVPVTLAALSQIAIAQRPLAVGDAITAGDFALEQRALDEGSPAPPALLVGATATHAIEIGSPITSRDVALPPPLARGTQVAVDVRRGAVHVRGTAVLELAARPGDHASARPAQTKIVVHGTLVAPATLVVGDSP